MKELLNLGSIVLLGNFNPAIFHPEWFDRYKILPLQETQEAVGQKPKVRVIRVEEGIRVEEEVPPLIVSPHRSNLSFPSLNIEVGPNRFQCIAKRREDFTLLKQTTIKIFRLLEHTPIQAVGINFHGDWRFGDRASTLLQRLFGGETQRLGDVIGGEFEVGGTISYVRGKAKVRLTLEKSSHLAEGISFAYNFHRETQAGSQYAMELVEENFHEDQDHAVQTMKKFLGNPEETWADRRQQ